MRENFLVLNFREDYAEIGAFKADFTNKEIGCLRGEKSNSDSLDKLKSVLSRAFYPYPYKIILALDSERAFGIRQSISFSRDEPRKLNSFELRGEPRNVHKDALRGEPRNVHKDALRGEPEKPLDAAELQNIISQIVLKFFEENRRAGVKQLNLSEADLLLFDTKVYDFKINGGRVIDPLNCKGSPSRPKPLRPALPELKRGERGEGKEIEIDLAQTFLNRNFYQSILSILPRRARLAWVADAGVAAAQTLSRISPRKKFIFAKVLENRTDLFLAQPAKLRKIVFWDYFKWGKRKFYGALEKNLKVEPHIAESLVKKYLKRETSRIFNRKFKQIISGELITLIRGLRHASEETRADFVYLDFEPFGGQLRGLRSSQLFPKMVKLIDAAEMADALGFKLKGGDLAPDILFLSPLIEFYFLPREDLINHLAKRRMRWLMA